MTVEQVTNEIDREAPEVETKDENAWKKVFWSDENARLVGNFLRGEAVAVDESPEIFSRLAESTDLAPKEEKEMRNRQKKELRRVAEEKLAKVPEYTPIEEAEEPYGKIESEKEYGTVNRLMGRTIMRVAIGSLVSRGVMSPEGLKYLAKGKIRKKEGGYMYDDWMGEPIEEKETPETPEMTIMAPVYQTGEGEEVAVKEFGNRRLRGSFAHEVGHQIRTLSNRLLWAGAAVDRTSVLNAVKRLFVGGYRVGSNKQGSEEVGNLFSEVVKLKAGERGTKIVDLLGPIAHKLKDNLGKDKVEPRYRVALTALLDHLVQLDHLGYGDLPAENLLALGVCGYSSLEKMPDLIRAGVMTQEKHEKMKLVAGDILGWLTSKSESGFSLSAR